MGPPRTLFSQGHGATRSERPEVVQIHPDGRRRSPSGGIDGVQGAHDDRRQRSAPPLVGGAERQEDRPRGRRGPQDGRALHVRRDPARARSRRGVDRRGGSPGRAVRSSASARGAERRVERDRAAPRAHRALDWRRRRDACAAVVEGPHAARARPRPARQLRHALALRPSGARVARQALDGARRRSAPRPGGAGRLRQDGLARGPGDGAPSHALGAHRDARVQPLPVRLANVPADDRGRVRGTRPRLDVLRRDHRDADPRQHQGDGARPRRAQRDAGACLPRLRAGARSLRRPRARALAEGQAARRESGGVRSRELVRRRDVHGPRPRSAKCGAVVP